MKLLLVSSYCHDMGKSGYQNIRKITQFRSHSQRNWKWQRSRWWMRSLSLPLIAHGNILGVLSAAPQHW